MKLLSTLPLVFLFSLSSTVLGDDTTTPSDIAGAVATAIQEDCVIDHIDLSTIPDFASIIDMVASLVPPEAIANGTLVSAGTNDTTDASVTKRTSTNKKIDVHTHIVPDFYRNLVPTTGGNPTPVWDVNSHLAFMQQQGIGHSVLAISAPGSSVWPGDKDRSIAMARLLNLAVWAYVQSNPGKFSFYAVLPLPYTTEAIAEAKYALDTLGAVGVILQSNHEGYYLGNTQFKALWQYLGTRSGKQIVYIHPNSPQMRKNGQLFEANPTLYATGLVEFYFETARTLMDLTYTQTFLNYTNINYVIPHVGGAFPSIIDRMIKSNPSIEAASKAVYSTRVWWDSAGPTYYNQVKGLLGYGIPKSQLVFGTDFPYAPSFTYPGSLAAIENADFLTDTERQKVFVDNARTLFAGKLPQF